MVRRRLSAWFGDAAGVAVCRIAEAPPVAPGDARWVFGARETRVQEFAAGRWCARSALADIGIRAPAEIGVGRWRQPLFPTGTVGTIAHDGGLALAVAVHAQRYRSVGVDLHRLRPATVYDEIARLVRCGADRVAGAAVAPMLEAALLFAAKEAVVKAISPMIGAFLEPTDIVIRGDADDFDAVVRSWPGPVPVRGHWCHIESFVLTGAWVTAPATGLKTE